MNNTEENDKPLAIHNYFKNNSTKFGMMDVPLLVAFSLFGFFIISAYLADARNDYTMTWFALFLVFCLLFTKYQLSKYSDEEIRRKRLFLLNHD